MVRSFAYLYWIDGTIPFIISDACEPTFPFVVLQDLLETQTIASCSHIFSWIEARAERLTEGLVPQKGKALILLRTLNDLLRRLSKMGSTTIFCGRILTFLSAVFPLGERSGVNLRGEYGPTWEGVKFPEKQKNDKDTDMNVDEPIASQASKEDTTAIGDQMQVDSKKTPVPQTQAEKKESAWHSSKSHWAYISCDILQTSTILSGHFNYPSPNLQLSRTRVLLRNSKRQLTKLCPSSKKLRRRRER